MLTQCCVCKSTVSKSKKRYNESKKYRWKIYCSRNCLKKGKNKQIKLICSRSGCNKSFFRIPSAVKEISKSYCSQSCSAIVNNPITKTKIRVCNNNLCLNTFTGNKKFCSKKCISSPVMYTKEKILEEIKHFYRTNNRIPTKLEFMRMYKRSRLIFGTWNKAIEAAGYEPNPQMFSRKHMAKDGHKCDSLAEKIIDDWLFKRKIKHELHYPYPGKDGFTADFKVGKYWIEFFGLSGQLKRYDELKKRKIRLANQYNLHLIELYQSDLFPRNQIEAKLNVCFLEN